MDINQNHKIVQLTACSGKLRFVKAIKDNTKKSLFESKNIADALWDYNKNPGVLLLNESSITVEQWERIAEQAKDDIEWRYVVQ